MDLMRKLESWMEIRGLTEQSRQIYRWVASDFLRFCEARGKPVSKESVLEYMSALKVSSGNRRWRWTILKRCFRVWGLGWFGEEEEEALMPKPQERVNRQVLSLDEFLRLYEAADREWFRLALRIGAETGARRLQIAMLLREHFDPKSRTLHIPAIKRSLDRVEILSEELSRMLSDYLARRSDPDPHLLVDENGRPLTPQKLTDEFKRLRRRAGIDRPGLNMHSLRRSWATWNFQAGMRELEIMRAGGWKTPSMVSIYVGLQPSEAVLRESELHPLKRRGSA